MGRRKASLVEGSRKRKRKGTQSLRGSDMTSGNESGKATVGLMGDRHSFYSGWEIGLML